MRHATGKLVLLLCLSWGAAGQVHGAPPDSPSSPPEAPEELAARATERFLDGVYDEARVLFERAHALDPAPSLLFNVGRCREEAGQYVEAVAAYRRFLEAAEEPGRRQVGQERLADVLAAARRTHREVSFLSEPEGAEVFLGGKSERVGVTPVSKWLPFGTHEVRFAMEGYVPTTRDVTLSTESSRTPTVDVQLAREARLRLVGVPDGASVLVGDEAAPERIGHGDGVRVPPGTHRVEVRASGRRPYLAEVVLEPGQTRRLRVTLAREPRAGDPRALDGIERTGLGTPQGEDEGGFRVSPAAWTMGGVTLASLTTAVALGLVADERASEARDLGATPGASVAEWEQRAQGARRTALVANIGYAVAGASALTTGIVLWTSNASTDQDGGDRASHVSLVPSAGPGARLWIDF
ncbi:MAG: PEGA domain-containing protein [Myxococcota bacterium]